MTIETNALVGIIEKLSDNDKVWELNINEMTVNIQKQQLPPAKPLSAVKRQYILEHAMLNVARLVQAEVLGPVVKASWSDQ